MQIVEYDLVQGDITCTTGPKYEEELSKKLANTLHTAINSILLDENNENVVILQNDSFLFVLEKGNVNINSLHRLYYYI